MSWNKSGNDEEYPNIFPINGPADHSFKLKHLPEVTLIDWPPSDMKILGWDVARKEMERHWEYLSSMTIWSPFPALSYSWGSAEAPSLVWDSLKNDELYRKIFEMESERKKEIHIRLFLFPLMNPTYQSQAVAQVILVTKPLADPGDFKAWVDALGKDELTPENLRDINIAIRNS